MAACYLRWGSEMVKKNGMRTRAEAKKLMWEYYRDNKTSLPKWIVECREEVLTRLQFGAPVADVFSQVICNQTQDTVEQKLVA